MGRRATSRWSCQTPSLPSRHSAGENPFTSSRVILLVLCDSHHELPSQPNSGQSTKIRSKQRLVRVLTTFAFSQWPMWCPEVAFVQPRFHRDVWVHHRDMTN